MKHNITRFLLSIVVLMLAASGVATAQDNVLVAYGTSNFSAAPTPQNWKYSATEMTISYNELGGYSDINSIAFRVASNITQTRNLTIRVVNIYDTLYAYNSGSTTMSNGFKNSIYSYDDPVFTGSVTFTAGWVVIPFQLVHRFDYGNGIAVLIEDHTNVVGSVVQSFYNTDEQPTSTVVRCISYRTDNNPSFSTNDYSNFNGYAIARPAMRIGLGSTHQVQVGDLTSTASSTFLPASTYYKYSYSQQIFTAEEMNGPQTLTSITLNSTSSASTGNRSVNIFLAETNRNTFPDTNSWLTLDSLTRVFTGTVTYNQGENTIHFDRPFNYSGQKNLVLAFYDNTGTYITSRSFTTTSGSSRALYAANDSRAYTLSSMHGGNISSSRNNIRFGVAQDQQTIGSISSSNTNYYLPTACYWRYAYTQQLFPECTDPAVYTSVSFYQVTDSTTTRNLTFYMGNAGGTYNFASTTSWIPASSLQQVFSGQVTIRPGWNTVYFTTPYSFSGNGTLTLACDDNTGTYLTGIYFRSNPTPLSENLSLHYHSDATNPNPASFTSAGILANYRNVVRFGTTNSSTNLGDISNEVNTSGGYTPYYAYTRYSYVQQIFTPDELNGEATFNSISFYGKSVINKTNHTFNGTVYLGETTMSTFNTTTATVPLSSLTQVFTGTVSVEDGWTTINFDTPYHYSGTQNLVIAFDDNTGSSRNYHTATTRAKTNSVKCYYSSTNINPSTPSGTATRSAYRAKMRLGVAQDRDIVIGDTVFSSTTPDANPLDNQYYENHYSQQIFTAEEMNGANNFNSISFFQTNSNSTIRDVAVFMGEVRRQRYTSNSQWVPSDSLTLVFRGPIQFDSGWVTIPFMNTYTYNGTNNLVLAFQDSTGTYVENTLKPLFKNSQTSWNRSHYFYRDGNVISPSAPGTGGYTTYKRTVVRFGSGEANPTYTITVAANSTAGGTVSGSGTYPAGYTVPITATPASGYHFFRWNITSGGTTTYSTDNPLQHTVSANATITAVFSNCVEPSNLQATAAAHSITLGWDGTATRFQAQYKLHSASSWSTASTSTFNNVTFTGLTDSTEYDYRVRSYCGTAEGYTDYQTGTIFTLPVSCTEVPTLTAGTTTSNSIAISWTGTASAYEVSYKASSATTWSTPVSTTTTSYTATGLSENTAYQFKVRAVCSDRSHGSWSSVLSASTSEAPCPAPDYLSSTRTTNSITISWTGTSTQYRVAIKLHSASSWPTSTIITGTSHTFTGLTDSTQYDYRVRSYCSSSNTSAWVSGTTSTNRVTCDAPTAVSTSSVTCSTAVVSWTGTATSYEVSYKLTSASTWSTPTTVSTNTTTLTGLTASSGYSVRVRAVCSSNSHSDWTTAVFTTSDAPCEAPTNLAATHTSSSITITWNGTASSYQVSRKLHTASSWGTATTVSNTSYTYNGLTDSTEYDYRVRGYCSSSNTSAWVTGSTITDPVTCNAPTAVSTSSVTCSTAVVSWTGSASSYQVSYKLTSGTTWSTPTTVSTTSTTLTDLTSSSNYSVRVRAVCSSNSHSAWTTATFTTSDAPCAAPTNLAATHTSNSITITWNGTATSYQVSYKLHTASTWGTATTTTNTTYTFSGLTDSTEYDYRVRGYCSSSNVSTWATGTTVTDPVTCNAPTAVSTSSVTCSTAVVSWTGTAMCYQVSYKLASSSTWSTPTDVITNTYTLTGLDDNEEYNVRVRAICSTNSHSAWTSATFTTPVAPCPAPTNLTATPTSSNITISWNGTASQHRVAIKLHSASTWPTSSIVSGTSLTFTGLTDSTEYDFRVRGYCSSSNTSAWVTGSATTDPVTCNAPTAVNTSSVTCSTAVVSWTGTASSYEVSYKLTDIGSWSTPVTVSTNTHTLTGLYASSDYSVRVRAVCSTNSHSAWTTATFTTSDVPCPVPTNLAATHTSSSITITWSDNDCGYQVSIKPHSSTTWGTATHIFTNTYTFTGLTDSTEYDYRVRGYCSSTNTSAWVSGTTTTDPVTCNAPTAVSTSSVTCSTAVVSWTGTATSYQVSYKVTDGSAWGTPVTVSTNTYTLTGLDDDEEYSVRVRAVCSDNSHSAWTSATFTTPVTPCPAPTNLAATHTSSSITVTWDGTASTHRVAYKLHSSSTWHNSVATAGSSYTFTGLSDSTEYDYRVRGYCSSSNTSAWVVGTTTMTDPVTCNAPTAVSTSSVTCSTAVVSWTGSASSYQVSYKLTSATTWGTPITVSTTSTTLTDLTASSGYSVRVRAVCSDNSHSAWTSATFTTGDALCDAPTALATTATSSSITLSWSGTASNYDVAIRPDSSSTWGTATNTTSSSYTFTGLTDSTYYQVRVRANCSSTNQSTWATLGAWTAGMSCDSVTELYVSAINNEAYVAWSSDADNYELCYKTADDASWNAPISLTSTFYYINGLTASTNYNVRVRAVCGPNSHSDWNTINFTTEEDPCPVPEDLASTAGTNSITITWDCSATTYQLNCKPLFSPDWGDTITVTGTSYTFTGLADGAQYLYRVRSYCSESNTSLWIVSNDSTSVASCDIPTNVVATPDTTSITLSWNGTATSYQVAYMEATATNWNTEVTVFDNAYTFTSLNPGTEYQLRVRAVCDTDNMSEWVVVNSTTLNNVCNEPTNLVITPTVGSATLTWTAGNASSTSWEYEYGLASEGYTHAGNTNTTTAILEDLSAASTYNVRLREICGDNNYSEWVVSEFTTLNEDTDHPTPTNLTVSEVTNNSAYFSWGFRGDEEGWSVHVYNGDFDSIYFSSTNNSTCNNLASNTQYYVTVAALWDGAMSNWCDPVSFTTTGSQGIVDVVAEPLVVLHPNPAHAYTNVSIEGMEGEIEIRLVDYNGRILQHYTVLCQGDCKHTIDISNLSAGAYFVQLGNDEHRVIRKLIVR